MSPFSRALREIRERRSLRQKDLSILLGYEQSYISALETGSKGLPREEFFAILEKKLGLTESEKRALRQAVTLSSRTLTIPAKAKPEIYELAHAFEAQLTSLTEDEIRLLSQQLRVIGQSKKTKETQM